MATLDLSRRSLSFYRCCSPTMLIPSFRICIHAKRHRIQCHQRNYTISHSSTEIRPEWKQIFDECIKKKHIVENDWYEKPPQLILEEKAIKILKKHFRGSLYSALSKMYPESNWVPWKFKLQNVPFGYWADPKTHRLFFDHLGKQIGIQTLDDWYDKLSIKLILDNGGAGMLARHGKSARAALIACYPEHNWLPWRFKTTGSGFWPSVENQRKYFDWLGQQLGVKELDDWYSVLAARTISKNSGSSIMAIYKQSPFRALTTCYPEHNWLPWKFNTSKGFWKSQSNIRQFFDWLGKTIKIKELDDWYTILNNKIIIENGGVRLLAVYHSAQTALQVAYPEHKWEVWRFSMQTADTWKDKSTEEILMYMNYLSKQLSIQTLDDWYRVSLQQLRQLKAGAFLNKHGGLYKMLVAIYPHHPWSPQRFVRSKKAQRWLIVTLKKIFPNEGSSHLEFFSVAEILEDYFHPKLLSQGRNLQLDAFLPSRSLAIEYQGKQHFEDVHVFGKLQVYQRRDELKRTLCQQNNIKLVEVPYWWDGTQKSLQEILAKQ